MTEARLSVGDKRRAFRQLHESGCFVIPNPWDVESARFLQSLGFKALATTSSGFAWSRAAPMVAFRATWRLRTCTTWAQQPNCR
jgi:2-methylisocitrate lyase-like PEP mutase family enzyme